MNFKEFNSDQEHDANIINNAINNAINNGSCEKTIVPYNENRVVIFNSSLIHETDKFEFKKGYENRCINVTLLFGRSGG